MLKRLAIFILWGLALIFLLSGFPTVAAGGVAPGMVQLAIGGLLVVLLIRRRRWLKRQV